MTVRTRRQRDVAGAIVSVRGAGGLVGPVALSRVRAALSTLVPPELAGWLVTMAAGQVIAEELGVPMGPAQEIEDQHAGAWLALYLVAAAGRLAGAQGDPVALAHAKEQDERYFELHLFAERRRMRAAALVDMASRLNEDRTEVKLLGWRAVIDDRTTPECRAANGRNFRADRMPLIGWPGAVHMRCRCSAGPPVPGAPLIPSV